MLEIVAKRAALRPSEPTGSLRPCEPTASIQSEPVSLPVLPTQTTINPLMQQLHLLSDPRYQPVLSHVHTFSSQSHNQEHDVSSYDDFMFDGTENFYLRTNISLMHDCDALLEEYESIYVMKDSPDYKKIFEINAHFLLVIVEFLVLYIGVLYYSFTRD